MASFIWTWPLESAIWVITAHRTSEGVANGTCTQVGVWMTYKCRTGMEQRKLYNVRDLPHGERLVFGSLGGGAHIPPSCSWWIRPNGNSYPRTRSSSPRIMRSSSSVFLAPTRSSLTFATNRCLIKAQLLDPFFTNSL